MLFCISYALYVRKLEVFDDMFCHIIKYIMGSIKGQTITGQSSPDWLKVTSPRTLKPSRGLRSS